MTLAPGRTLTHYEILDPLGSGAMGEVYRARDTRLGREVAIKVLPEELAGDPERLRRFEREARVLASLNHPNVAQVYSIDREGDTSFMAMELVPGQDLSDLLDRGPLLLDEALELARQIAEGLESAHEAGVVHRDLKPANVRVTPQRQAKVLDFGLSKPLRTAATQPDRSVADRTATRATMEGVLLGTPAYMSPEQARGRPVDRRTDIWAFGCVLYESLTGKAAFAADTVGDLLGTVLSEEPDWAALESRAPARIVDLVRRCLRKDPRRRLRDIGDARLTLEEHLAGEEESEPALRPRTSTILVGAVLVLGGLLGFVARSLIVEGGTDPMRSSSRYSIALPRDLTLATPTGMGPPLTISDDGRAVAFAARGPDGIRHLFLRHADGLQVQRLDGTEMAEGPFMAPDGKQVGFFHHGQQFFRVQLADGSVHEILREFTDVLHGVSWGRNDSLVAGSVNRGLRRIPLDLGPVEWLTSLAEDEVNHRLPQLLADGETVLFTSSMRDGSVELRLLSMDSGGVTRIPVRGAMARYLPGGFLVFNRSNDLFAVRFDLSSRTILGEPVRVLSGIHVSVHGNPHFAVATDGSTLVYEPMRPPSPGRGLVWVDRQGNPKSLSAGKGFEFPRVSEDGRKIAVAIHGVSGLHEIWVYDAQRGAGTVLASGGNWVGPDWFAEGGRLLLGSFVDQNLYVQGVADQEPTLLLDRPGLQLLVGTAPGGKVLFLEQSPESGMDVFELDPASGEVRPLLTGEANEEGAEVSPNGRMLAYASDEAGRRDVYLTSYPSPGAKELLTPEGGTEPVWAADGKELFFRRERGVYSVAMPVEPGGSIGEPELLFEGDYVEGFNSRPNYDVSADGTRFIMVEGGLGLTHGRLDVVLDFEASLERSLPLAK